MLKLQGFLKDYNSLIEIDPASSVNVISSNNPLPAPKVLTLNEAFQEKYEGQLVRLNDVRFSVSGSF